MRADLHCHSTASDGTLTPTELVLRAAERGLTHLAITDHDSVAAYASLPAEPPVTIVPGIELSSRWRKIGVHVVGLDIDPADATLAAGIERQQQARRSRAATIARRLERTGLPNLLEAATQLAGAGQVGRPHFARQIVAGGHAKNEREAYRRWLGAGKPGDVRDRWPELDEVIGWITAAGGVAVLAHPAHYRLTRSKLAELVADFRAAGGRAVEVVSGRQDEATTRRLAELAADAGLYASCGSDFHEPGKPWAELGGFPALPAGCRPVWSLWNG